MGEPDTMVDGRPADSIVLTDRGFAYGDGVFRTLRVVSGRPLLWPEHWQVLQRDAGRLDLPLPAAWLRGLPEEIVQLCNGRSGVLRLVVSRGSGPRGDRPPRQPHARRALLFYPSSLPARDGAPRRARVCRIHLPHMPQLAGIKHLNRLVHVLARQEWYDNDPAEGLLLDQDGYPVCGTMSNLFVRCGSELLTPMLDRCGVAGVMRARLLNGARAGRLAGIRSVAEIRLTLEQLIEADEVLMTNAVIGGWPLSELTDPEGVSLARWSAHRPLARAWLAHLQAEEG